MIQHVGRSSIVAYAVLKFAELVEYVELFNGEVVFILEELQVVHFVLS